MGVPARVLSLGFLIGLSFCFKISAAVGTAALQPSYSYASEKSYRAADFLNALGINLDMGSAAPRYNVNAVVDDLIYTGFKHARGTIGSFANPSTDYYYTNSSWVTPPSFDSMGQPIPGGEPSGNPVSTGAMLQMFAAIGVHVDATLYLADPVKRQSWLDANVSHLDAIEGPNEVDGAPQSMSYNGLTKVAGGAAVQKTLYGMVKKDPNLTNIPVYNMTIGHSGIFASSELNTGNLAPDTDYGNIHPYAIRGAAPYAALAWNMLVTTNTPGKPFVVTETGYPTASYNAAIAAATGTGTNIVSENIQGRYLLDDVFDAFNLGIIKTYVYQLIDYQCDPSDTNAEMHFGLFRCDNTPKPAAVGFHNLQVILRDSGTNAASFNPAPLSYMLQQSQVTALSDAGKFHTLLQKQDGTYELVLWGEPELWDYATHSEITAGIPVNNVTVTLNNAYRTIKIYDPLRGSAPISQLSDTKLIKLGVSDHPLIIEIGPVLCCGSP